METSVVHLLNTHSLQILQILGPGAGTLKFNNANLTSASILYIDDTDGGTKYRYTTIFKNHR